MWIEIVVNGKVNASTKSLSGREMNLSLVFIQSFSLLGKGWKKWKVEQKVAKAVKNKEKKDGSLFTTSFYSSKYSTLFSHKSQKGF